MTQLLFTLKVAALTTLGVLGAYQHSANISIKNKLYFIKPYAVHVTPTFQIGPLDDVDAKYFAEPLLSSGHLVTPKLKKKTLFLRYDYFR